MDYILSNIKLNFSNLDIDQINFLNYSLISNSNDNLDVFTYKFNEKLNQFNYNTINKYTKLANAEYANFNNKMYVNFYNGNKALWDIIKCNFIFYNNITYNNIRNWFFLNIIDPFSLACIKHNKMVLHGSFWESKGNGIILSGESGSGKSTLSFLAREKANILSDDVLVLSMENNEIFAEPINSGFGIKKNLIDELMISIDSKNILVDTPNKIYFKSIMNDVNLNKNSNRVKVRKLIILEKGCSEITEIKKTSYSTSINTFLNLQTSIPNPNFTLKFTLIKSLLNYIPVYCIKYHDKLDLNLLMGLIEEGDYYI